MHSSLAAHLSKLGVTNWDQVKRRILEDPQAHIDALVEGGALRAYRPSWSDTTMYDVIPPKPPHEHQWIYHSRDIAKCDKEGCNTSFHIPVVKGTPYHGSVPEGL